MIRAALPLSALLLTCALPAQAQVQSPPTSPSPPTQLDRIENKLDEILRRLAQPSQPPSTTSQALAAPSAATLPSPLSPPSGGSVQTPSVAYLPGALVVARPAPRDFAGLPEMSSDKVGGFVYQGGPIALTDIRTRGVRYAGPVSVEIQGWLTAKETGRYQFGTDLTARFVNDTTPPVCVLHAWIEGRSLDQRTVPLVPPGITKDATASLVQGADLQPGIYRVRLWSACTPLQGVSITSELLLKAPSELNLRPVTSNDLLHRED